MKKLILEILAGKNDMIYHMNYCCTLYHYLSFKNRIMRELVVRAQATHYLFHRKGEKTFFCPQKIKQKKSNETYKQLGNYFFSNGIFSRAKLENGEDFHSQKEGKVAGCRAKPRVFGGGEIGTFDYSCQQKKTFPSTSLVNQHPTCANKFSRRRRITSICETLPIVHQKK